MANVQIGTLESKCKELMLENMTLNDEVAKLNEFVTALQAADVSMTDGEEINTYQQLQVSSVPKASQSAPEFSDSADQIIEDLQSQVIGLRHEKDSLAREMELKVEFKMPFELQESEVSNPTCLLTI